MKEWIFENAKRVFSDVVKDRRALHARAEVGFDLPHTRAFVIDTLKQMGYEPKVYGKGSVVACVGKTDGRTLLLRADMDALPIKEQSGLAFACKTGTMHACGHDLHTAILLGVARLLKEKENQLNGCVKLLFQPAEETLKGARDAVESGVLSSPKVHCAMMLHALPSLPFTSGTLIVSQGGVSAPSADYFKIVVSGKSAHGATPHQGVDAISVGARILLGLEELMAKEIPSSENAVVSIGRVQAGTAGNVVADRAEIDGTLRTFDEDLRAYIKKRIREIAGGIAKSFRARARVLQGSGCPSLINDEKLSAFAEKNLTELLGERAVISSRELKGVGGGSEDFAYISREVPSLMIGLCAGEKGKGYDYPLHHPKVRFDEKAMLNAVAGVCYLAFGILEE